MSGTRYEVRVKGDASDCLASVLSGASVTTQSVVQAAVPDQAALHGLLAWIDSLGLELLEVRHARPTVRSGPRR